MTTPETESEEVETPVAETQPPVAVAPVAETEEIEEEDVEEDERKRRLLLLLLLLLLVCLCCVCGIIFRYWLNPQPLPEMLLPTQVGGVCYKPTYKFSIGGVSGPMSVSGSPDDQRVYVAEGNGNRLVKVFDRDGKFLKDFAPPGTDDAGREPKYMAVSPDGRVFLVDLKSAAIDIYTGEGVFIDAIIGQHLTLSKFLASKIGPLPEGTIFTHYDGIKKRLTYQVPGQTEQTIDVRFAEDDLPWSPLSLRFDPAGNLIYSDSTPTLHSVRIIPAADLNIFVSTAVATGTATPLPTATGTPFNVNAPLVNYNPVIKSFGTEGKENAQFEFPQTIVMDTKGNYYVSDGNNARITVWTPDMQYKTFFGFGSAVNGALNLPRGTWMNRGCLHVADAVGSLIRVYDITGAEPQLAFEIGEFGVAEGQFNYPVDVYIDGTGRLYIADRANNRIQVWSY